MREPLRTLTLDEFEPYAQCSMSGCTLFDAFRPVSCKLEAGRVYGLLSEFAGGAWAFSWSVGGRANRYREGRMLLNGQPVTDGEMAARACFVGELPEKHLLRCCYPTVRRRIERALKRSGLPYTAEQIKDMFALTDARFDRRIDRTSGESWLISQAVGFAQGKEIFCWPWMDRRFTNWFTASKEHGIFDVLRAHGKIVLVPSSRERMLREGCDQVLRFDEQGGFNVE